MSQQETFDILLAGKDVVSKVKALTAIMALHNERLYFFEMKLGEQNCELLSIRDTLAKYNELFEFLENLCENLKERPTETHIDALDEVRKTLETLLKNHTSLRETLSETQKELF